MVGLLEFRSFGLSGEDPDICLDLIEGMPLFPDVRGSDWIVPRLDGRQAGNRRLDIFKFPIAGFIRGTGTDAETRREDWLANTQAVMAVMDPTLDPGSLVLSLGYLGLGTGETATLTEVRCRNAAPGKVTGYRTAISQLWSFEMECLLPDWDAGSS